MRLLFVAADLREGLSDVPGDFGETDFIAVRSSRIASGESPPRSAAGHPYTISAERAATWPAPHLPSGTQMNEGPPH
jgi:hypothetical protein